VTSEGGQPAEGTGRLVVGLVRGLHGLRGQVRVEVLTDDPARFQPGSVLHPEGDPRTLTVVDVRDNRPPGLIVTFNEVRDRAAADELRDTYLEADAPAILAEGTYYWHEIIGSRVLTRAGSELGTVADIFRTGEAEVYVVRGDGPSEVLVPAVGSVVVELAPRDGRIVVDEEALGLDE
jgi:16S rRNA processing protein RimM